MATNDVESYHSKILDKAHNETKALKFLKEFAGMVSIFARKSKKSAGAIEIIAQCKLDNLSRELLNIESDYELTASDSLAEYFMANELSIGAAADRYFHVVSTENTNGRLRAVASRLNLIADKFAELLDWGIIGALDKGKCEAKLAEARHCVSVANSVNAEIAPERHEFEVCACTTRFTVIPDQSEQFCATCGKINTLRGVIFRDDQFYTQDKLKTKSGDHNTKRHYDFWKQRIEATENKIFTDEEVARIEYRIQRDRYDRQSLNIITIRAILKETKLTRYNDHAALICVNSGGPVPPRLNHADSKKLDIWFHKAMNLYDQVVEEGSNKTYYPYWFYKGIEHLFAGDQHKLRLLDYIHLQSSETVIKNDKIFEQMCALYNSQRDEHTKPEFVYKPTDPVGRI